LEIDIFHPPAFRILITKSHKALPPTSFLSESPQNSTTTGKSFAVPDSDPADESDSDDMDNRSLQSDLSVQEISHFAYNKSKSKVRQSSVPLDEVESIHDENANNGWSSGYGSERRSYSPSEIEDSDEQDEQDNEDEEEPQFDSEIDEFGEHDIFEEDLVPEETGSKGPITNPTKEGMCDTPYQQPDTRPLPAWEPNIFNHVAYSSGYDMFPSAHQTIPTTVPPRMAQPSSSSIATNNTLTDQFPYPQFHVTSGGMPAFPPVQPGPSALNYARPQMLEIKSLVSPESTSVSTPRKRNFEDFERGNEETTFTSSFLSQDKPLESVEPVCNLSTPEPQVSRTFSSVASLQAEAVRKAAEAVRKSTEAVLKNVEASNATETPPTTVSTAPAPTQLLSQTTQTIEEQLKPQEQLPIAESTERIQQQRPSKRRRLGDVALGIIVGGITTVATLASLPEGYFA
jgi:hypothetical protein